MRKRIRLLVEIAALAPALALTREDDWQPADDIVAALDRGRGGLS
jgi:hypothetical protein